MKSITTSIIISLAFIVSLHGQPDTSKITNLTRTDILKMTSDDLLSLSFEDLLVLANKLGITIDELLKMKTSVASKTALTPRETPGIVSIITDDEIKLSGARDLIDVLQLVPGLNFNYDDGGVVGIQMRGNWGHEGKVLLIIDGQEINELKYNTLQFGRHYDVNQIKRIEIIRGPGSSIYGGNAELGVINIITNSGSDLNKIEITGRYGQMKETYGQKSLSLNAGKKINNWDISMHGYLNKGNRSDQIFRIGNTNFDLSKNGASTEASGINLGVARKTASLKFIYDSYGTEFIVGNKLYTQKFNSLLGELKKEIKVNDKLSITPKFNFRNSIPYYKENWYLNNSINRISGNITLQYTPNKFLDIVGGAEFFNDKAKMIEKTDSSLFSNNKKNVSFNTTSAFLQGIVKTSFVNFIVGGRIDSHNEYGSAFAPRVGLTRTWERIHFKALYSGAYRSPAIGNILLSSGLEPEKTTVAELEMGYKLNENMFLTANIYDIVIKNPIIWYVEKNIGQFRNENKTGSKGLEIEYRFKYTWGFATLNYAYYEINKNTVTDYHLSMHPGLYPGAPSHKLAFNSGFNLTRKINIAPSAIYFGKRYFDPALSANNTIDPAFICNFTVNYNNFLAKGFTVSAGVFDLFDNQTPFVQAYVGRQYPFPRPSREFFVQLKYSFAMEE